MCAEYEPSEMNLLPSTKVSWLFDELSDNNASDDGLSLGNYLVILCFSSASCI